MISKLIIRNFKSILELKITCKKLNIFIGEPNSGKSNILEALALKSQNSVAGESLNGDIFRFKTISDLFFDFNINNPIEVITDEGTTKLEYALLPDGSPVNQFNYYFNYEADKNKPYRLSHDGKVSNHGIVRKTDFRYYEFKRLTGFSLGYLPHLSVPHGDNLPSLLLSNSDLKKWVSEFLKSRDITLTLKPAENDLLGSKLINGEIYSYPYLALSETLQRIIFYILAIKSNKSSILLLDEPDSNTFPLYTKMLAERIALDKTNQFFIATHNPYLLLSLIEKSKEEDIALFVTKMKNYQTFATCLDNKKLSKVVELNTDVFFNLDKLI